MVRPSPRPSPAARLIRVLALVLGLAAALIPRSSARAAPSWDVIVPSELTVSLCGGCGMTFGGAALIVNAGTDDLTAADLATASFTVQSSQPDIPLYLSVLNEGAVAPILPGEAVGFVIFQDNGVVMPNDLFLASVAPAETFRNTDPVGVWWLGINRDAGAYEGTVVYDVTMEMAGRLAFFTVRADVDLGIHRLTFVTAQRVQSVPGSTPAVPATWGAIKKLYR